MLKSKPAICYDMSIERDIEDDRPGGATREIGGRETREMTPDRCRYTTCGTPVSVERTRRIISSHYVRLVMMKFMPLLPEYRPGVGQHSGIGRTESARCLQSGSHVATLRTGEMRVQWRLFFEVKNEIPVKSIQPDVG
jgi:hypothetical protein